MTTAEIVAQYDIFDDDDISTERLLTMTCDACQCDADEVIDALLAEGRLNEAH